MNLAVFIHIAILPRWEERVEQYLNLMNQSGLLKAANQVVLSFVGEGEVNSKILASYGDKIVIHRASSDLNRYELPTQKYLYDFCYNNLDYKVLYIHTKGVGKEINQCIEDWIDYMTYFCITSWKDCLKNLEIYQTVGVDLRDSPTLHYSGNFWWAKSSYIAILPDPYKYENIEIYPNPINSPRHNQEFWICFYKDANFHKSMWESNINCYERHLHRYPPESYNYRDKVSIILHGKIHPKVDINKTVTEYRKYGKIILSIYTDEMDYLRTAIKDWDDITLILNDMNTYNEEIKKYSLYSTHYFQLQTTKKGLDLVKTPYVIKSRVDHYYSNIDILIKRCFETNKICASSLYTRAFKEFKYHISDNLFIGKTEEIRDVINLSIAEYPFPNQELHPNEVQLWKPYIMKKAASMYKDTDMDNDINTYVYLLSQIFEIISISYFKPYLCKLCEYIVSEYIDEYRDTEYYLTYGCKGDIISIV